jgi:ABC-type uncharacterized transport system permease subunit
MHFFIDFILPVAIAVPIAWALDRWHMRTERLLAGEIEWAVTSDRIVAALVIVVMLLILWKFGFLEPMVNAYLSLARSAIHG